MNKLKTGQDIIKERDQCGSSIAGFNRCVLGIPYNDAFRYRNEQTNSQMQGGWNLAEKLIKEGGIYFVHNFHKSHGDCPSGFAFQYGGFWVCNTCGGKGLDKDWWTIKVYQDGNAWCCVGLSFENLQESENYAFGDSREEAIASYGDLFHPPEDKS